MKKFALASVLALAINSPVTLPVVANPVAAQIPKVVQISKTIPVSAAIVFTFPAGVVIDAKEPQEYSLVALLAQPIQDSAGEIVAPVNSPIKVLLKPTDKGAELTVDSLIIQGRVTPIQTSNATLIGEKVSKRKAKELIQENSRLYSQGAGGVAGAVVGSSSTGIEIVRRIALLGVGLGSLDGLFSSKKALVVRVPQGSVYMVTLQAPIPLTLTDPTATSQNSSIVP